jgi:exosortase A-associated hydrolase 2
MAADGGRSGQRYALVHDPAGPTVRGAVLYVHPFAEEMNKARRMAALQSRALAQAGFAVLQLDLLGCGDSSGDFADATWAHWLADVLQGAQWLRQQHAAPLWLWGLRAGCLLASQAAAQLQGMQATVNQFYWQPPPAGKVLLQQFLRLSLASGLLDDSPDAAGSKTKPKPNDTRQQLASGQNVEIAGYTLQPALATGLEQAQLQPPASADAHARCVWLETSTRNPTALLPATEAALARWRQAGHEVHAEVVPGPAFWQTQEIEDAPALLQATTRALLMPASAALYAATPQVALA